MKPIHPIRSKWDMPHRNPKAYSRKAMKGELEEILEELELDKDKKRLWIRQLPTSLEVDW